MLRGFIFASCLALSTVAASASVRVELIDRGTPVGGGFRMDGYRAFVLRVVSDVPMTRIDAASVFGNTLPQRRGIFSSLIHYWEDPNGDFNFRPTPGPDAAQNTTNEFPRNFDSHFLPLPAGGLFTVAPSEGNVTRPPSGPPFPFPPIESAKERLVTANAALVGDMRDAGFLTSDATFSVPQLQHDLAYLVVGPNSVQFSNARIQYGFDVYTTLPSTPSFVQGFVVVPEPTMPSMILCIFALGGIRVRR